MTWHLSWLAAFTLLLLYLLGLVPYCKREDKGRNLIRKNKQFVLPYWFARVYLVFGKMHMKIKTIWVFLLLFMIESPNNVRNSLMPELAHFRIFGPTPPLHKHLFLGVTKIFLKSRFLCTTLYCDKHMKPNIPLCLFLLIFLSIPQIWIITDIAYLDLWLSKSS